MEMGKTLCLCRSGDQIMAEGTIKSYDALAYYVNDISELDPEVVSAHKNKDEQKESQLLSRGKNDFDIFICVNKHSLWTSRSSIRRRFEQRSFSNPRSPTLLEVRALF